MKNKRNLKDSKIQENLKELKGKESAEKKPVQSKDHKSAPLLKKSKKK